MWPCLVLSLVSRVFLQICHCRCRRQKTVYPYPLGAGSARPNPKMGAPAPENPSFLGFSVLRGGLRPWSRKGPDHGVGVDPETLQMLQALGYILPFETRKKMQGVKLAGQALFAPDRGGRLEVTSVLFKNQLVKNHGPSLWVPCRNLHMHAL